MQDLVGKQFGLNNLIMDLFAFLDGGEMAIGAENRGEGECAGWDAVLVHFRVEGDGMGETLTTVRGEVEWFQCGGDKHGFA